MSAISHLSHNGAHRYYGGANFDEALDGVAGVDGEATVSRYGSENCATVKLWSTRAQMAVSLRADALRDLARRLNAAADDIDGSAP